MLGEPLVGTNRERSRGYRYLLSSNCNSNCRLQLQRPIFAPSVTPVLLVWLLGRLLEQSSSNRWSIVTNNWRATLRFLAQVAGVRTDGADMLVLHHASAVDHARIRAAEHL